MIFFSKQVKQKLPLYVVLIRLPLYYCITVYLCKDIRYQPLTLFHRLERTNHNLVRTCDPTNQRRSWGISGGRIRRDLLCSPEPMQGTCVSRFSWLRYKGRQGEETWTWTSRTFHDVVFLCEKIIGFQNIKTKKNLGRLSRSPFLWKTCISPTYFPTFSKPTENRT